jgi:hypothetical protein
MFFLILSKKKSAQYWVKRWRPALAAPLPAAGAPGTGAQANAAIDST